MCIDLDGSSGNAGILSPQPFAHRRHDLHGYFDIAGSQRGGSENPLVSFGTATLRSIRWPAVSPWKTYSLTFTPTASAASGLTFNNAGGDNMVCDAR